MATLTIKLPPHEAQTEFNLRRWDELLADRELAKIESRVLTECPLSTADGVRAADVAWVSQQRLKELGNRSCFPHAPEICVEVLSPGNTDAEIREKMALYFDAGAGEVWLCETSGDMKFFSSAEAPPMTASKLCPDFPAQIQLSTQ